MALATRVVFTFVDDDGDSATTTMYVPTGFTVPDLIQFGLDMGQILVDLSLAQLTKISITLNLDISATAIKAAAAVGAAIGRKAQFIFNSAVQGFTKLIRVPTYDESLTPANSDDLDQGDPTMSAFIDANVSGIATTGGTMQTIDKYDQDLVGVKEAREYFRTD